MKTNEIGQNSPDTSTKTVPIFNAIYQMVYWYHCLFFKQLFNCIQYIDLQKYLFLWYYSKIFNFINIYSVTICKMSVLENTCSNYNESVNGRHIKAILRIIFRRKNENCYCPV